MIAHRDRDICPTHGWRQTILDLCPACLDECSCTTKEIRETPPTTYLDPLLYRAHQRFIALDPAQIARAAITSGRYLDVEKDTIDLAVQQIQETSMRIDNPDTTEKTCQM